jgi:tRNA threonylcarbamoyladenosine biosynthesis protein TsaB
MTKFASALLALDTTGRSCSVAVWRDGAVAASRFEAMERGQSERLVPMVEETMKEAAISYDALDAVAVTLGPGAFTGVRIGLAAGQGFALAWGLPLIGVSSFEAVAHGVSESARCGRRLYVVLDSKRDDFFLQSFDAELSPASPPKAVAAESLAAEVLPGPALLAGDAAKRARALMPGDGDISVLPGDGAIQASTVAGLVAARPLPSGPTTRPAPLYLRAPDVTLPATQGRSLCR